jgi:hypothetical protein
MNKFRRRERDLRERNGVVRERRNRERKDLSCFRISEMKIERRRM